MHCRRPVVQVTALPQRESLVGVIVITWISVTVVCTDRNSGAVGVARGAQIGTHPTLVANLYGAVHVPVNVRNRRSPRTGFLIHSEIVDFQFQRIHTSATGIVEIGKRISAVFGVSLPVPSVRGRLDNTCRFHIMRAAIVSQAADGKAFVFGCTESSQIITIVPKHTVIN